MSTERPATTKKEDAINLGLGFAMVLLAILYHTATGITKIMLALKVRRIEIKQ